MVGIDIIEIDRIKKASSRSSFLSSIYTESEIEYYNSNGKKDETLAGIFSCKEAVSKALGTGFSGFKPIDIEVKHGLRGKPFVVLYNGAKDLFEKEFAGKKIEVSISHCITTATAICFITD